MKYPVFFFSFFLLTGCNMLDQFSAQSVPSAARVSEQAVPSDLKGRQVSGAVAAGTELYTAATLSDEEVAAFADRAVAHLDAQHTMLSQADHGTQRVQKIVADLGPDYPLALDVRVYDDPQVNAFSFADGSIRFYSGLVELMTDDELRGILGHEIGHIELGHSKKQLQRAHTAAAALKGGLAGVDPGTEAPATSLVAAIAEAVLQAQFSQTEEMEADTYGLSFLARNEYPVRSLSSALKKLSLQGKAYSILDSHPSPEERLAALQPQIDSFDRMLASSATSERHSDPSREPHPIGSIVPADRQPETDASAAGVQEPMDVASTPAAKALLESAEKESKTGGRVPPVSESEEVSYSAAEIVKNLPKIRRGWYVLSQRFENKFDAELQALDMPATARDHSIVQLSGATGRFFHLLIGPFYKEEYARKNLRDLLQAGVLGSKATIFYTDRAPGKKPATKAVG